MGSLFVSYRRKDTHLAHRLAEKLERHFDDFIFIDRKIREDDFEQALLRQVRGCNVFALVVTEHTFDPQRIHQPNDWVRREIHEVLTLNKPIALAFNEGVTTPSPDQLPSDLHGLLTKQGIFIYSTYFDECVAHLARHCADISGGKLHLKSHYDALPPTPRREDVLPPTPRREDLFSESSQNAGKPRQTQKRRWFR